MPEDDRKDHDPERGSLVDKHGFDDVMRGLLAVPTKPEKKITSKNQKKRTTEK